MSIESPASVNRYLSGQYEPVRNELDAQDLQVTGSIPAALSGNYFRNGANPQFDPITRYHVFDGDGMVHSVRLEGGRASYHNRFVESKGLLIERRMGEALFGGLSEFRMPPEELLDEAGMMKNTANTNIVWHGNKLLALMEAGKPIEMSKDLETIGEWDYEGALIGPMTAHPKEDPETGELLFFGYSPFPPYLRFHQADASGALIRSVDISLPSPVMMHDFAVSRRHVVFFDLPAVFDLDAMMNGGSAIEWLPDNGARIGVLDRQALDLGVRWIEIDPFYVFHFLNAYDDGDSVVVDGCRSDRLNISFGDDTVGEAVHASLHRWRINPSAGTISEEILDERAADFPRINNCFAGLKARYGYLAHTKSWDEDQVVFDGVTRHDLQDGTSVTHIYGENLVCGEAVFAPAPERSEEDAGWLLNIVSDQNSTESALVILDAQEMTQVACVHLPRRVPFGFHGNWVAD